VLNAITVSNETKDAERNVEGAELIDTAKGEVQVLEEGDPAGKPIVLVHCYTCSMHWWDELAPLLAADHRVIRTDLLGHGGSAKPGRLRDRGRGAAIAEALAAGCADATVGHLMAGAVAEQSPVGDRVVTRRAPELHDEDLVRRARLPACRAIQRF
jgi:pimeloyl-ACP methyl ester carboxylesterase